MQVRPMQGQALMPQRTTHLFQDARSRLLFLVNIFFRPHTHQTHPVVADMPISVKITITPLTDVMPTRAHVAAALERINDSARATAGAVEAAAAAAAAARVYEIYDAADPGWVGQKLRVDVPGFLSKKMNQQRGGAGEGWVIGAPTRYRH